LKSSSLRKRKEAPLIAEILRNDVVPLVRKRQLCLPPPLEVVVQVRDCHSKSTSALTVSRAENESFELTLPFRSLHPSSSHVPANHQHSSLPPNHLLSFDSSPIQQ